VTPLPGVHAGQPGIRLQSPGGDQATVLHDGAHVVSWIGRGAERLYLSPTTGYGGGVAIRGGVPIVFPQFNQRGPAAGLPKHGFARNRRWRADRLQADAATFALDDDEATRTVWPHRFRLELAIDLTEGALRMALTVTNAGSDPFEFTAALHTYLAVADIRATTIEGLAGARLLDTVIGREGVAGPSPLGFDAETDRIYWRAAAPLTMRSPAGTLGVSMAGFEDVVVWNPWSERAAALPDLPDDDWRRMLCIEAARIGRPIRLAPGAHWQGSQTLACR
jgi:glucose-6-phosphate 1-epimerase